MKDTIAYIETDEMKYPIIFNLNVMEEIQEQYGSLAAWGEKTQRNGEPQIKDLKAGVMAMLNEAIDIENEKNGTQVAALTGKQVGRIMTKVGIDKIVLAIQDLTVKSTATEGEGKNE